jgi:hypothetical protein
MNKYRIIAAMIVVALAVSSSKASAQNEGASLNTQLQTAVCQQDWARAIQVIDRMRAIAPDDRRGELAAYRARLQAMLRTNTQIPNWQCGTARPATPVSASPNPNNSITASPSVAASPSSNSSDSNNSGIQGVRRDPGGTTSLIERAREASRSNRGN